MVRLAADRFLSKFTKGLEDECWEWRGPRQKSGHGYLGFGHRPKHVGAHRIAYLLELGEIPSGLHVCHRCDNPPCVNPAHLFLGTAADNHRDKAQKGRSKGPIGSKNWRCKLTPSEVIQIRCEYAAGGTSFVKLGKDYGVGPTTIEALVTRRTWRHVA